MKRKFVLFGIVQIVFFVLFYFSALLYAGDTSGLAPFNSGVTLTQVSLNEPTSVEKLKKLAKDEKLNIAVYDEEKKEHYIYFADATGPATIFGASGEQFVYNKFGANGCASTDGAKGCPITLSSPNKQQHISIRSLDWYEKKDAVDTITVYPSEGTSQSNPRDIFISAFPSATFMGMMAMRDSTVYIPYAFFVVISVLVLLSITQQMYKEGKERGVQRLFGWNTLERTIVPFIAMIGAIIVPLAIVYGAIYHYITFDWSFIWPAAVYCVFIAVFAVVWLGYHQWNIHRRSVNVLMNGFLGSKLLTASYIVLSVGFLTLSGAMMPLLSQTTRDVIGKHELLSRYESELTNAGVMFMTSEATDRDLKGDEEIRTKESQVMQHFGNYLEYKSFESAYYYTGNMGEAMNLLMNANAETPHFQFFLVNKNFIANKISNRFKDKDFSDEEKLYIFSKNPSAQAAEIEALKHIPNLQVRDESSEPNEYGGYEPKNPTSEVIQYDNAEVNEYVNAAIQINGPGKPDYVTVTDPIYVVRGGVEDFGAYSPYSHFFADDVGRGYYMPLRDASARAVWDTMPTVLAELGASEYFDEPITLAERGAEFFTMEKQFLYIIIVFSLISLISGVILILIFLQAFFRSQRKQLVLKRLFGRSFFTRYGIMFGIVSLALFSCWLFVTFKINEWELFNGAFIVGLSILVNGAMRLQIGKLEADAMNSVIKE